MNVFVTPESMKHVLRCVQAARDEVLKDEVKVDEHQLMSA
jgi:hypothetical protein